MRLPRGGQPARARRGHAARELPGRAAARDGRPPRGRPPRAAEQAERLAAPAAASPRAWPTRSGTRSDRSPGSIELLRTGGTLTEEDQKLCEIIERETARLNDLVGDMLDLVRPRARPCTTAVDLATVARDLVLLAAKSGRGVDVRGPLRGAPRPRRCSPTPPRCARSIWNLDAQRHPGQRPRRRRDRRVSATRPRRAPPGDRGPRPRHRPRGPRPPSTPSSPPAPTAWASASPW